MRLLVGGCAVLLSGCSLLSTPSLPLSDPPTSSSVSAGGDWAISNSTVTININQSKGEEGTEALEALGENPFELVQSIMENEGYVEGDYELEGVVHVCYGHAGDGYPTGGRDCVDLLIEDIAWALYAAFDFVGEDSWESLGARRQGVLAEIAYMTGREGLFGFGELQKAVRSADWTWASKEILDSKLPEKRAAQLAEKMK